MSFALLLDIIITFLLAGTIYYVWKLSDQLARFRASRNEMDRLVRELNTAVDRSQGAILALRETAQNSGEDLQKLMRQATELSDELQLMNESANSLATRLENAVARERTSDVRETPAREMTMRDTPLRAAPAAPSGDSFPSFSIRDPEFDNGDDDEPMNANDDDWGGAEDLRSEAEKELFRALQQNKKTPRVI